MTKGLLKSTFLHLGILMIFVYGAEIFKQNKRFEIYEIPLDIVDISEKTVNKTKVKKKISSQKKKNQSQTYGPPGPKSKPSPPKFELKQKKKKKKKKKDKESKEPQEDKNRLESILKSIEKIKTQKKVETKVEKKDDEKVIEEEKDIEEVRLGEKLTISEKDAIRRQFYRCWIVPAGAKDLKDLFVSIKIKLDREGNVISSKLINKNRLNESFFRAAAESALRAVNHPECKKLKVPEKKYKTWKEIILDFDPSQSVN